MKENSFIALGIFFFKWSGALLLVLMPLILSGCSRDRVSVEDFGGFTVEKYYSPRLFGHNPGLTLNKVVFCDGTENICITSSLYHTYSEVESGFDAVYFYGASQWDADLPMKLNLFIDLKSGEFVDCLDCGSRYQVVGKDNVSVNAVSLLGASKRRVPRFVKLDCRVPPPSMGEEECRKNMYAPLSYTAPIKIDENRIVGFLRGSSGLVKLVVFEYAEGAVSYFPISENAHGPGDSEITKFFVHDNYIMWYECSSEDCDFVRYDLNLRTAEKIETDCRYSPRLRYVLDSADGKPVPAIEFEKFKGLELLVCLRRDTGEYIPQIMWERYFYQVYDDARFDVKGLPLVDRNGNHLVYDKSKDDGSVYPESSTSNWWN